MAKAIIYIDGSDEIRSFIKDAVLHDKYISGSNGMLQSRNFANGKYKVMWLEESSPDPTLAENAKGQEYYLESVTDFTAAAEDGPVIKKPERTKYVEAIQKRHELAQLDFAQLDTYIENNVTDLASAKEYLKKLSKVVLAGIKIADYESK